MDASLLQHCFRGTMISQLTGDNSFDTNSHCLFMTTEVILIFMLENEIHLHKTRAFLMDNCDHRTNIPPLLFFFDRLFRRQFYTHGLNHSSLAVFSLHQWKDFIFKSPQASFLKGPYAKQ